MLWKGEEKKTPLYPLEVYRLAAQHNQPVRSRRKQDEISLLITMTGAQRLRGRKYIPGWVRKPLKGCSLSGLWTGRFRVKGEAWVGQTEVWMSAGLSAALLTCVSYTWKSHLAFVFIACFLPALQSERVRFPGKVKIRRKIQNPPVHIHTGPVRWQPRMANAVSLQRKGWCSLCSLSTVLDGMKPI